MVQEMQEVVLSSVLDHRLRLSMRGMQVTRIYVCGPSAQVELAKLTANKLRIAGHRVVSTWHEEPDAGYGDGDWSRLKECAERDLAELGRAGCVVALCPEVSGGASFELGWAHAQGLRILLIGDGPVMVFHPLFPMLPDVESVLRIL